MNDNLTVGWEAPKAGYSDLRNAERNTVAQELFGKSFEDCDVEQRLQCHPDKCPGDEAANERFQRISMAYSVLSDEQKRRYYDQTGTTEGLDISPDEFLDMFQSLLLEIIGGADMIKAMLSCFTPRELARLPPFPFPKELFPPGTFPPGLRFSSKGLKGLPPQIDELIQNGDLHAMFAAMSGVSPTGSSGGFRSDGASSRRGGGASSSRGRGGGGGNTTPLRDPFGYSSYGLSHAATTSLYGNAYVDFGLAGGENDEFGDSENSTGTGSSESEWTDVSESELEAVWAQQQQESPTAAPSVSPGQAPEDAASTATNPTLAPPPQELPPEAARAATQRCQQPAKSPPSTAGAAATTTATAASLNGPACSTGSSLKRQTPGSTTPSPPPPPPSQQQQQAEPRQPPQEQQQQEQPQQRSQSPPHASLVRDWMMAARGCDLGALTRLLQQEPGLLGCRGTGMGHTALHWCAAKGSVEGVGWLLRQGMDINVRNDDGATPLHAAARNGRLEAIEALLSWRGLSPARFGTPAAGPTAMAALAVHSLSPSDGTSTCAPSNSSNAAATAICDLAAVDGEGRTALQLALQFRHMEVAALLLRTAAEWKLPQDGRDGPSTAAAAAAAVRFGVQEALAPLPTCSEASRPCSAAAAEPAAAPPPALDEAPPQTAASERLTTAELAVAKDAGKGRGGAAVAESDATASSASEAMPMLRVDDGDATCGSSLPPAWLLEPAAAAAATTGCDGHGSHGATDSHAGQQRPSVATIRSLPEDCRADGHGYGSSNNSNELNGPSSRSMNGSSTDSGSGDSDHCNTSGGDLSRVPDVCATHGGGGGNDRTETVLTGPPPPPQPPPPTQTSPPVHKCAAAGDYHDSVDDVVKGKADACGRGGGGDGTPSPQPPQRRSGLTLEEKMARRAALLAADAAAEREEARREAEKAAQAEAAAAAAGLRSREEGRAWLEAARRGDLPTLERMLAENPRLLSYQGQGTSFAFTLHTALHWAAARGHTAVARWLLQQGADPDLPNAAGATPLHAAASQRADDCARLLVLEAGAKMDVLDSLGDTVRDILLRGDAATNCSRSNNSKGAGGSKGTGEGALLVSELELLARVAALRDAPGGCAEWAPRAMRGLLASAGVNPAGLLERRELVDACQQLIARYPSRIIVAPSAAIHTAGASGDAATAVNAGVHETHCRTAAAAACSPLLMKQQPVTGAGRPEQLTEGGCDASAAGEGEGADGTAAAATAASDAAKQRGNEAFSRGDFSKAVSHYTMAMRLNTEPSAVLYSNRAAAYCGMLYFGKAQADAEAAILLDPQQPKYHCRLG
ncbi:molecular chaperone, partial [Volvox carteri f. nagariensis]